MDDNKQLYPDLSGFVDDAPATANNNFNMARSSLAGFVDDKPMCLLPPFPRSNATEDDKSA